MIMIADLGSDQQLIDHNRSTLKITDRDRSIANVVKPDLVSPGSLLYNSNYAMDVNVFPCVLGAQCHMRH